MKRYLLIFVFFINFVIPTYSQTPTPTMTPTPSSPDEVTKLLLHFDDGFSDSTFFNNSFEVQGEPKINISSKFGNGSLFLDGSASIIYNNTSDIFDIEESQDFTIETWFKINGTIGSRSRLFTGTNNFLSIIIDPTRIFAQLRPNAEVLLSNIDLNIIQDDDWHHIALVRFNDDSYLYIDGVEAVRVNHYCPETSD